MNISIMSETYGHLAPECKKQYPGRFSFVQTEWGTHLMACDFGDLEMSPWLYTGLMDKMYELSGFGTENSPSFSHNLETGLYEWHGIYVYDVVPDEDNPESVLARVHHDFDGILHKVPLPITFR